MHDYHRFPGEVVQKGHSAYLNQNITKWCALCGSHKAQLGGTIRFVLGGRHWVCAKHPKVTK